MSTNTNGVPAIEKAIKGAVDNKKVICALTYPGAQFKDTGIEPRHWYAIIGYEDGMVQLFNPWGENTRRFGKDNQIQGGKNPAFWMTIKDFHRTFHEIDYEK